MASKITDAEYNELISLLKSAAQVEHALLNAYLYAACTIKGTSQEFKYINMPDGSRVLNLRRAIQFEKARNWKRLILEVCHEEMIHLHYVQCLLRALGEKPYFDLPAKDETDKNAWFIPNWVIQGVTRLTQAQGTKVPVKPFSLEMVKRFVAYESTDALQDSGIFSDVNMAVYREMHNFELDLHVELALYRIDEGIDKCKVRSVVKDTYKNLPVTKEQKTFKIFSTSSFSKKEEKLEQFQSIKNLYDRITELYKKADDSGLIRPDLVQKDLNGELHDNPEGLLPVGPVFRTTAFSDFNKNNNKSLAMNFKDANNIIQEIISEGEGCGIKFIEGFDDLLKNIAANGGLKNYAGILLDQFAKGRSGSSEHPPKWVTNGELLRKSHLYRFIEILMDIEHEQKFDPNFDPARKQIENSDAIKELSEEMMSYFNANFLAMITWLSRIYMLQLFDADQASRKAIAQLATWPLMSLVMRPFLEILSFFPVDLSNLYNLNYQSKYSLEETKNLQILRIQPANQILFQEIDECIFKILNKTAEWSIKVIPKIKSILNVNEFLKTMIITRVETFKNLREFGPQFKFREAGGYSEPNAPENVNKNSKFPQDEAFNKKYSENPQEISITSKDIPLYTNNSWLLKLSFCGFSKMQFASDPDPPTDESGCTGTSMFHSADGDNRILTRTTLWNPNTNENIAREACDVPLGVNVYKVALTKVNKLEFDKRNGEIESNLQEISSFNPVKMFFDLKANKNGRKPFYLGDNHLIWGDGEPIDPFILSLSDGISNKTIAQREVFNEDKSMRKMEPIQRSHTHRGPSISDCQGGLNKRFCENVLKYMPASYSKYFSDKTKIDVQTYFNTRANSIFKKLLETLNDTKLQDQDKVDKVISFFERLYFMPYGNAVGALNIQFSYWHTISGDISVLANSNTIFDQFAKKGYNLHWSTVSDRTKPNSRWYTAYAMSFGDFDALNNCCYGNLYIPVTVTETKPH